MILRDYQLQAVDECRAHIREGVRRILIHSGTGTGKTVIASEITRLAVKLGNRVLFMAHRKELIDQPWKKLKLFGIEAGVIMATDSRRAPWLPVQVASVQTLVRRSHKPVAHLVIVDECHRAPADTYQDILKHYPEAVILGLTATPCRGDDKGLSDMFDVMVSCPSVRQMTMTMNPATGVPYLVPTVVYAPTTPKLEHKGGGDYMKTELASLDKPKIIGDIVAEWLKHGGNRQTVVFAASIPQSQKIVENFKAQGVIAEHLDGMTPKEDREAMLERLESGNTRLVSNVGVLTEGWDSPNVACVVLARPTNSMGLFLQMCGRALRPAPGKKDCVILDHGNCHAQHGFVDDDREWSLAAGVKKKPTDKVTPVATCKVCYFTFPSGPDRCAACGSVIPKQHRNIQTIEGELQRLERKAEAIEDYRAKMSDERKFAQFQHLRREAAARGYKKSYVFFRYNSQFHEHPKSSWYSVSPEEKTMPSAVAEYEFELGSTT